MSGGAQADSTQTVDDAVPAVEAPAENPQDEPVALPAERIPCSAPAGVSGSPRDVSQLVELMNSLPKPTSLACLLETLDRPLELYLTSSKLSLQPADGVRNPRTFIVRDELVLSVVPGGESSSLLEIGYISAPGRSIKGEIEFPLTRDVTASGIVDRIRIGDISICGGCHGGESRPADPFFPDGAFESAVAEPLYVYEVDLESLREEARVCDPAREAGRCGMLSALFDRGEVTRTSLWANGAR